MHNIMDPPVCTFAGSIVEPTDVPTEDILPPTEDILPQLLPSTEDILPALDNIPVIPSCRDIDSLAPPSARSQGRISHWASVGFCNRRPRKGARNMSQGLRALVLLVPQATNRHVYN